MTKFNKAIAACALAIGFAGGTHAAIIDFTYNGGTVATLTTSGNTDFSLTFVSAPGAGAFINDLFLVGPGGNYAAAGGQPTSAVVSYSPTGLGDGNKFNWKLDFPQSGSGTTRFTLGETFQWSITATNPDAWDLSMLHINAFLNGDSIKLTGCDRESRKCVPVPEPGTLALLGLGLLGAGLARRRRA